MNGFGGKVNVLIACELENISNPHTGRYIWDAINCNIWHLKLNIRSLMD